ncbi:four-carbon acid sugar kinase family protein [Poseidonocella sp. HB161398]|uniref:four-carbon acid sugar kinase family protein n=1 Tax=Poseidonocella sp. HB161398 TaxID=2320855 RepID=UPI001107CF5E|nr:four-carbon acid sugar kinase family protein [Poseidonocella sp. HB161398]
MPALFLVADDLTGALDSGAAFAARGMRTAVARGAAALPAALATGADVIAVSTGTRERPATEAREVHAGLRAAMPLGGAILFKKIDSRLKGNIAAELDGLLGADPRPVFACPALPRLGRRVEGGALAGTAVAEPIPIAPRIGRPAAIPDIASEADLNAALPADPRASVLVGAAGLAEALARRLCPGTPPRPAAPLRLPLLLAIGSRDPVTLAQLAAIRAHPVHAAPNGALPQVPDAPLRILQMTAGPAAEPPAVVSDRFAAGLAQLVRAQPPAAVLACGGETADALLGALGAELLLLEGELAPGIPVAQLSGPGEMLRIATKSGGFGGPDALQTVIDAALAASSRPARAPGAKPPTAPVHR